MSGTYRSAGKSSMTSSSTSRDPTSPGHTTSSTSSAQSSAVVSSVHGTGSGNLRAPTELGQYERGSTTNPTSPALRHVRAHPGIVRMRKRAQTAVRRQFAPAVIEDERNTYEKMCLAMGDEDNMTLFTSFSYNGMEVLVSSTGQTCYLLCPRTKIVLQTLDPVRTSQNSSSSVHKSTIISLRSHPATGQIVAVTADGTLCSYLPKGSNPLEINFGRLRWYTGPTASCSRIFYNDRGSTATFAPARRKNGLEVCLADDFKVLVAHRDQLAVLDAKPQLPIAELLWTTCLPCPIVTAQLSGDAQSIAVVLEPNPDDTDSADADGVHTLERDWEDGGSNQNDSQEKVSTKKSTPLQPPNKEIAKAATERRESVGLIYKPGPFLVHSAPVTRLSFRGTGRETSNPPPAPNEEDEIPGNDLLLTISEDNTAQIFGQSNWKPLTEWTLSPKTRVDWIAGTAAMTLGDLEGRSASSQRKKGSGSASSSRRPSGNSSQDHLRPEAVNEDATNRHSHFATIPTHTTPVSKAGAWICEICCDAAFPSMRLSRLTYLKRGADGLSPTVFESVSGYLPANAIFERALLGGAEDCSTLTVEGLWSIWNPYVADSTTVQDGAAVDETLRGSAMAFLGLSSAHHAAGPGGTFFGDPQLIGTQCPPTELRLTVAHLVSGFVTVLEFPLYGDKSLTSLELGWPTHSVLAMNELNEGPLGPAHVDVESTDHGHGRLVAKIESCNVISLAWRQAGTTTLLPFNWQPNDISLPNVSHLLASTRRMQDESMLPVPLALRPFLLPEELGNDEFVMLLWWPDTGIFGAPPTLLALTKSGCAVAFEVITPLVSMTAGSNATAMPANASQDAFQSPSTQNNELHEPSSSEYEVSIIPDPELGLGLRLESLDDGQPAIAGSFKKNPETGESLPAEKTGMITIGDELISANGVALEDKSFDEIIACVRELGTSCGRGHPMRLLFRRQIGSGRSRANSGTSEGSNRRTLEQMFGVNRDLIQKASTQNGSPDHSISRQLGSGSGHSPGKGGGNPAVWSYRSPIPGLASAIQSNEPRRKIVLIPGTTELHADGGNSTAIFCCADKRDVIFSLLSIPGSDTSSQASNSRFLFSFVAGEGDIDAIQFLDQQHTSYFLIVLENSGLIRLLVATIDISSTTHSARAFDISTLHNENPSDIRLRAHSVELFATFDTRIGRSDPLLLWSAQPHPGSHLSEEPSSQNSGDTPHSDYSCTVVAVVGGLPSNGNAAILDFGFIDPGYLDSDPWFIVFGVEVVTLYNRPVGSDEWLTMTQIFYTKFPGSSYQGDSRLKTLDIDSRPSDIYPHLPSALRAALPSSDEAGLLRSDWHPEALLSSLCMNEKGAEKALNSRIKGLFLWLCSEGASIQEAQAHSPLLCVPLQTLDKDNENASEGTRSGADKKPGQPDEIGLIKNLLRVLAVKPNKPSRHANLDPQSPGGNVSPKGQLPSVLGTSRVDDLTLLWAIGELVVDTPDFRSIDVSGQLFVFSSCLYDILHNFVESKKEVKPSRFVAPSVLCRDTTNRKTMSESSGPGALVSSGACLSALMSNSQERLLEWARTAFTGMNWDMVRRNRIPFWLRSDKSLARVSEEVGQTIFREKRDVMECAIFFIVARKLRTLRNLAATDRSDSGQKFFKFLTSHDFTSERGKRAAEKNAFSLLRKCRYQVASAFFLLSEPPALQSALETIVAKLHDVDLAFMVARLMDSKELGPTDGFPNSGIIGGGGGGYAGSGIATPPSVNSDTIRYDEWSPSLGSATKKLLVDKLFKLSAEDHALSAIQLLWLQKREEASWWLPGFITSSHTSGSGFKVVDDLEVRLSERLRGRDRMGSGVIVKANAIIDFASIPALQRRMNVSSRSRYAGCLWVCDQLISRGVEVPSLWTALVPLDESTKDSSHEEKATATHAEATATAVASSSIFDSFDVPSVKIASKRPAASSSSIFDSFDVPSVSKSPVAASSSIFDSYDVPTTTAQSSGVQSSIFDDFDVPNACVPKRHGNSQSSGPCSDSANSSEPSKDKDASCGPKIHLTITPKSVPEIWLMWKDRILLWSTTRRLLREVGSILAFLHGDPPEVSVEDFFLQHHPIVPSGASEALQVSCDAAGILARTKESIKHLATASGMDGLSIVNSAVKLVGSFWNHFRLLFSVLLYSAVERFDLAESLVRSAATSLIHHTAAFALAADDVCERRRTRFQASSIQVRRLSARIGWQLETCLWLHRSGLIPLSGLAFKEAVVSVRLGVLLATWNRDPEAIEATVRHEPDAIVDADEGMHLWSSLKHSTGEVSGDRTKKTISGGWEFFVDCRRSEATKILRESPTGSFIIRPHPNDHGVFTLSFKTNLVPGEEAGMLGGDAQDVALEEGADGDVQGRPVRPTTKSVKKDDIVQHAIIRLSDSGFRCGSFGPFTSLLDLLESVSESLPFELRFDLPPSNRAIREEGSQPSPNAVLFRKLALSHPPAMMSAKSTTGEHLSVGGERIEPSERNRCFGTFLDLLVLTKLRTQISGVSVVRYLDSESNGADEEIQDEFTNGTIEQALWIAGPLLGWCRSMEARAVHELAPSVAVLWHMLAEKSHALMDVSDQSIEITLGPQNGNYTDSGDFILRSMIQRNSGVEFSTLRLVDGGECSMVVLFSKHEAVEWLVSSGTEPSESDATHRLERMERERVIEPIDFSRLPLKQRPADLDQGIRYRFVDPWEVEAVSSREGETTSASLGRQHFLGFSLGKIALACESDFRMLGGIPLLELWMSTKGGVVLSRAVAAAHPPWERASGGDLQVRGGVVSEPEPFANSIRQHLYRNALFQRLDLPQRFLALVQVELLDLKNLTSPGGSLSMSVYALLRLKRRGSSGVLSNKTRTLDTAATTPVRLGKPTGVGPYAPASWGSVVRFRYPLPDETAIDGTSFDADREALFKGPPSVLQITVYEKKLLVDHALGTADVDMDGLHGGGQVEEWVPLRSEKNGIHWFTRIRLTLRFELMCLASRELKDLPSTAPSVGLQRIETLCQTGGTAAHEDHKRSISSPDLLQYLESMVY